MRKANRLSEESIGSAAAPAMPEWLSHAYADYSEELARFLRRKFGPGPPEPEDVVQLAFERLTRQAEVEMVRHPRAFLYRVARNIFVSELRRNGTSERYAADASHEIFAAIGDEDTPERVYLEKERQGRMRAAFQTLPSRQRRMFIMNRALGLSYEAIARRFGVSPSTVRNEICRAIVALDAQLADLKWGEGMEGE